VHTTYEISYFGLEYCQRNNIKEGQHPNPLSCTSFYECVSGEFTFVFSCDPGNHYSPTAKKCLPSEVAGCSKSLFYL